MRPIPQFSHKGAPPCQLKKNASCATRPSFTCQSRRRWPAPSAAAFTRAMPGASRATTFAMPATGSRASPPSGICLATTSKNPLAIAREIMEDPFIYMHGPEHHVLVGSCLLAACRNAGRELDLPEALSEMERRGGQVPNGICAATPNAWASAALTARANLPLAPIKRAFLPA